MRSTIRMNVLPPAVQLPANRQPDGEPKANGIHQLFEAQAARTPDAVAVAFVRNEPADTGGADESPVTLTYAELNRRANQLAHYLHSFGIGSTTAEKETEPLVGLCVERSLEMVIALLAILKAGGAYVPLDPTYPQDRLAFMVEDANVALLLTQAAVQDRLPPTAAPLGQRFAVGLRRDCTAPHVRSTRLWAAPSSRRCRSHKPVDRLVLGG